MKAGNLHLDLEWTPREQNEAADDLTNMNYGRFDPALRIQVDIAALQFIVLTEFMKIAEKLHEDITTEKEKAKEKKGKEEEPKKRKEKKAPLRERAPW